MFSNIGTKFLSVYFLVGILLVCFVANAGVSDSLFERIKSEKNDSIKATLYVAMGKSICKSYPDSAEVYLKRGISIANATGDSATESLGWNVLGIISYYRFEQHKAIALYTKSVEMLGKAKDPAILADRFRNIGICFSDLGNFGEAASYFFKSLKIAEQLQDSLRMLTFHGFLGNVFYLQKDYNQAKQHFLSSLKISRALKLDKEVAMDLNNLGSATGTVENKDRNYEEALGYYHESFQIRQRIGDTLGLITCYTNISLIYSLLGKHADAEREALAALHLAKIIQEVPSLYGAGCQLAQVYLNMNAFPQAMKYGSMALEYARTMNSPYELSEILNILYQIKEKQGDPRAALVYYKEYISWKDSLLNEENTRRTVQSQMQFEFEKQQAADSIQSAERFKQEQLTHAQEISRQKIYSWGGGAGFLLMLVIAVISYRAYREKRKSNDIISQQKLLVEQKQKEILDSIQYARRIQRSLMPNENYLHRKLKKKGEKD